MQIPARFRRSLQNLRDVRKYVGNNRTIRQFIQNYDMVYFGIVDPKDEVQLVRGITMSTTKTDKHYCVGTAYGRDMIFVQRRDSFSAFGRSEREVYHWNILAIDLDDSIHLPHTFVEAKKRYGVGFRAAAAMRERDWVELPPHFIGEYSDKFRKTYAVHMPNSYAASFWGIVAPVTADQMVHYFDMFDYELADDTLYVYYLAKNPSVEKLDHMVKAGVWLAGEVEKTFMASVSAV